MGGVMEMLMLIGTAATAFIATNVDDLIVLIVFYVEALQAEHHSDEEEGERKTNGMREIHVIFGQYLGFTVLILISMLGMVFGLLIPAKILGFFGFLPLLIGLYGMYGIITNKEDDEDETKEESEIDVTQGANIEMHEIQSSHPETNDLQKESGFQDSVELNSHKSVEWDDIPVGSTPIHPRTLEEAQREVESRRETIRSNESELKDLSNPDGISISASSSPPHEPNVETTKDEIEEEETFLTRALSFLFSGCMNAHLLKVTLVCVANGGDNIAIYLPYFASMTLWELFITLIVFYVMCTLWLVLSRALIRFRVVAEFLSEWGEILTPFLLIGLGIFILYHTGSLEFLYSLIFS